MKPLVGVLLLLGALLATARAADADRIAPHSSLAAIRVFANQAWLLTIVPDGSAAIGYGSSAFDFASVPAGTFDFERVHRSLAAVVRPSSGDSRKSFDVFFMQRDVNPSYPLDIGSAATVLELFVTAKQNCGPLNKARIDELWERRAPSLDP